MMMDLRAATASRADDEKAARTLRDAQHVVAPHQTAVEEGQARRHEVHQRTGDQDPGRVAVVDRARALAHGLRVLEGTWDVGRRRGRRWQRFVAFI